MNIGKEEETVGQRIRRCREEAGLSQGELAEKAGVSLATVARIESGRIPVPEDFLQLIAEALGRTLEYLRGEVEETEVSPDFALNQYAESRFQNPEVREEFRAFAKSVASFRERNWQVSDLASVEKAFLEYHELSCERECFYLPGDTNGQV